MNPADFNAVMAWMGYSAAQAAQAYALAMMAGPRAFATYRAIAYSLRPMA